MRSPTCRGSAAKGGDRGALKSLRRGARLAWLAAQQPAPSIRYYSLVSFAERDQISSVLRPSYDDLSMIDPRNDGQLLFYDQIAPRSTLLGYLNADHWAIAMPIVRDAAAARLLVDRNAFPREILLEAILKQIEEDLITAGRVTRSGPRHASMTRRPTTLGQRVISVIGAAILAGCASNTAPVHPDATYRSSGVTCACGGIAVTASVLDQSEIEDVFGARLDLVGIQPVWLSQWDLGSRLRVDFVEKLRVAAVLFR